MALKSLLSVDESDFRAGGNSERCHQLLRRNCFHSPAVRIAKIVELVGNDVLPEDSQIEQEYYERYRAGRVVSSLNNGNYGLVSQIAVPGDEIFIFPGFRIPYVLRKWKLSGVRYDLNGGDPEASYVLIGEA